MYRFIIMIRIPPPLRAVLGAGLLALPTVADASPGELRLKRIVSGLNQPLYLTAPVGDADRLFILERAGRIRIYRHSTGNLDSSPFIDLSSDFDTAYSIAFDPNYATNGYFYIHGLLGSPRDVVVRRYTVSGDPDVGDPQSADAVMTIMPDGNHNGGWLGFSPLDGLLYITSGDGSSAGTHDPENDAQNPGNQIGKLLRIDVTADQFPQDETRNYTIPEANPYDDDGGIGEVRCIGFRNPWRASFDRATGDLFIGDVGEVSREEINLLQAGDTEKRNYGWRVREGSIATPTGNFGGGIPVDGVDPILDYVWGVNRSVTGGYVYRGDQMPSLRGTYFYGDYVSKMIGSFRLENGAVMDHSNLTSTLVPDTGSIAGLVSFGEDAAGELYIVSMHTGSVFHITRPYYIWLASHFSPAEMNDAIVSNPDADPDNDQLATLLEYVVGHDPRTASNPQAAFEYSAPDGKATVRVTLDPQACDVSLHLESSSDMKTWSTANTTVLAHTETVFEARDELSGADTSQRYIRIVATIE